MYANAQTSSITISFKMIGQVFILFIGKSPDIDESTSGLVAKTMSGLQRMSVEC
jgi:hypothetical protein